MNGGDGSLARGSNVATSGPIATGEYVVSFNQDVSACSDLATPGTADAATEAAAMIHVSQRAIDPNGVQVHTFDQAGTAADRSFHLAVFC